MRKALGLSGIENLVKSYTKSVSKKVVGGDGGSSILRVRAFSP